MTKAQTEYVLDAISKVSADIWDKSDSEKVKRNLLIGDELVNKAFALFLRKEAGDFIEPLNTDKNVEISLVQKYEDLLKNGMQIRKQIAEEMPITERVNIWKVQMAYHLATTSLNTKQRELIVGIIPRIQEIIEASMTLPKDEQTKYVANLEASLFEVFTKAEAFAVFMEIGIQKYVEDGAVYLQETNGNCNCRWYCSGDYDCNDANCDVKTRCGPFDTWDCTSRCIRS